MSRDRIRELRKSRGMSQEALAKKCRLKPSDLSRIECGYRDLSSAEAARLAKALNAEVIEIAPELSRPSQASLPKSLPPSVPAPPVAQLPVKPTEPPGKAGPDLSDPANFRDMPESGRLLRSSMSDDEFRGRLRTEVEWATKILHTSRVPPAVWVAWRDHERRAQELLRSFAQGRQFAVEPPKQGQLRAREPDGLSTQKGPALSPTSSKVRHSQRSLNAMFVHAARKFLPSSEALMLTGIAEKRYLADRSIGFMRHFRTAAYDLLPQTKIDGINAEIASNETSRKSARSP